MFNRIIQAWNRRSLPTSTMAARMVKCHYSQYGEDAVVEAIIGSRDRKGFFVDVGCFEPICLSNTFMLYRQGWNGLAIDPNADLKPIWQKYRPRDQFVCCAVGEQAGQIQFMKDAARPNESRVVATDSPPNKKIISVAMRRLDEILATEVPSGMQIDLMSIDCEGLDLSVLKSNDFDRFRPRIVIVEDEERGDSEIVRYMEGIGYRLVGMTLKSRIFSVAHQ